MIDTSTHINATTAVPWLLIAGFLALLMRAGLSLVMSGLNRAKNAAHTMAMNLMGANMAMLGFFLCGYAFMCGAGDGLPTAGPGLIGGPPPPINMSSHFVSPAVRLTFWGSTASVYLITPILSRPPGSFCWPPSSPLPPPYPPAPWRSGGGSPAFAFSALWPVPSSTLFLACVGLGRWMAGPTGGELRPGSRRGRLRRVRRHPPGRRHCRSGGLHHAGLAPG